MHRLTRGGSRVVPGALVDERGAAPARPGTVDAAQYLVRPDGHVGFRHAGHDLAPLERYLAEWYPPPAAGR